MDSTSQGCIVIGFPDIEDVDQLLQFTGSWKDHFSPPSMRMRTLAS